MTFDEILVMFGGKRYHACAVIALDIRRKKMSGDMRSIMQIISEYKEHDIDVLIEHDAIKTLYEDAYPIQNPLAL